LLIVDAEGELYADGRKIHDGARRSGTKGAAMVEFLLYTSTETTAVAKRGEVVELQRGCTPGEKSEHGHVCRIPATFRVQTMTV